MCRTICRLSTQRLLGVFALALAVGGSLGATSADPRDRSLRPVERLEALLAQTRNSQSEVQTLEAKFVQLKESSLLLEPSEARGVFSFSAPDRVRWEYHVPEPISLLISDQRMTTWYRDLETAETANVGKHSQRILDYLGAGSDLDRLLQYFSVSMAVPDSESEPFRLELEPRFSQVAKRIQGLQIWIDPESFLPTRLRYVEPDGDVTEYRFEQMRVNGELPEELFHLDLPRNVDVKLVELPGRPATR